MGTQYHRVPQDEDGASPPTASSRPIQSRWKIIAITSLATNALFLLSIFTTLPTLSKTLQTQSTHSCLRQTSSFSPVLSETTLSETTTTINGTLFPNSSPPSIWRSPPSHPFDTAWHNLSQTTPFAITHADILSLNRNPKTTFQIPESYGFGSDLYLAELDGQHHLHCLNMLRKYAYLPLYFPNYTSTLTMPVFHQNHLSHCLDILRQQLLCTFSTEVITYQWVKGQSIPQPDFSVQKQCKDWGVIRGWLEGKWDGLRLSEEQMVHVPRPVGVEGIEVEVEVEVEGGEYWDELVRKARAKGVDVHEYVEDE